MAGRCPPPPPPHLEWHARASPPLTPPPPWPPPPPQPPPWPPQRRAHGRYPRPRDGRRRRGGGTSRCSRAASAPANRRRRCGCSGRRCRRPTATTPRVRSAAVRGGMPPLGFASQMRWRRAPESSSHAGRHRTERSDRGSRPPPWRRHLPRRLERWRAIRATLDDDDAAAAPPPSVAPVAPATSSAATARQPRLPHPPLPVQRHGGSPGSVQPPG